MLKHLSIRALFAIVAGVSAASANENGLPVGRTGGFGEPSCTGAGCHGPQTIPGSRTASVAIEVGPYVPGAKQQVRVVIDGRGASSWGFQLSARRASDTTLPAGTFEAVNDFAAVRCPDGRFAPCAEGAVQYVTHTAVGARGGGQAGRQTFFFDWIPPGNDVGDIAFAVAALAADGDRGVNNDIEARATTLSLFAPSNQPRISAGGVVSAAAPGRPNQSIAPKQLISVFGTNLSNPGAFVALTEADFDFEGRVPTALNRLSFVFRVPGGSEFLGRMIFVGDDQANLQAPDFPTSGVDSIGVTAVINRGAGNSEVRSNEVLVPVARLAPNLFTFNSQGTGPAAAVNGLSGQAIRDGVRVPRGEIVLLFGTGFGATNPAVPAGERADGQRLAGVTAEIGGLAATVEFAGAAPNFVGLEQFNVRLDGNLPPGDHAVFLRSASGAVTQPGVTIAVGP